jgi:hypothetical protein
MIKFIKEQGRGTKSRRGIRTEMQKEIEAKDTIEKLKKMQ